MEKKRKRKTMIILLVIVLFILASLLYYFPLQRYFAEKKYIQYAAQQGVPASDIESKVVFKDYKQDGYFITVRYHSDPDHCYEYLYFLVERGKNGFIFNTMYCYVHDLQNNSLDDYTNVVYRPLEN